MSPDPPADLVTFIDENLDVKLNFLCNERKKAWQLTSSNAIL